MSEMRTFVEATMLPAFAPHAINAPVPDRAVPADLLRARLEHALGRAIRLSYDAPPIPIRSHDWSAYVDGEEECSGCVARGVTDKSAIANLAQILISDERVPQNITQADYHPRRDVELLKLRQACNGLLGLIEMICRRPDMTHAMRDAIERNHRLQTAREVMDGE
jgi:hypothetical protein